MVLESPKLKTPDEARKIYTNGPGQQMALPWMQAIRRKIDQGYYGKPLSVYVSGSRDDWDMVANIVILYASTSNWRVEFVKEGPGFPNSPDQREHGSTVELRVSEIVQRHVNYRD